MKTGLNLLPLEFRTRCLLWQRARQWTAIISVVSIVLLGMIAVQWKRADHSKQELAAYRARMQPLREKEDSVSRMQEELANLHATKSLLAEAERSKEPVTLLALVSRCADNQLQVKSLSFQSNVEKKEMIIGPEKEKKTVSVVITDLMLEGIAQDNSAVSRLVAGLDGGEVFDDVRLTTRELSDQTRTYSISCRVSEAKR